MKVLLVHAPKVEKRDGHNRFSIMVLPMGLVALAELARRLGWDVEILHLGLERLLDPRFSEAAYAKTWRPDLIGFSLHWHAQLASTLEASRRVRDALAGVPVVFGGLTASLFAKELLDHPDGPDIVIRGDGERSWSLLLQTLSEGKTTEGIPNLCRRGAVRPTHYVGGENGVAGLRFSCYDLVRNSDQYSGLFEAEDTPHGRVEYSSARIAYLCAGRGCTADCAFCSGGATGQKLTSGRHGFVFRPVEDVLLDLTQGMRQGFRTFGFCFDPPRKADGYYSSLFAAIRSEGIRPSLVFEFYNGAPDPAFLADFARTADPGRSSLELSPHTADETIRTSIGACRYDNARLEEVVRRCRSLRIRTSVYFALLPTSTWDEVRRTAAWIERLAHLGADRIYVLPIEVEPASPWHQATTKSPVPIRRRSFEDFLQRHSQADEGLTWPDRLGYELEDVEEKLHLMRTAAGPTSAHLFSAAGGI